MYIGVSFSKKGLWNLAAERAAQKGSIASASTLGLIRKAEINSIPIILKLFNALVNSVAIYASEI